MYKTMNENLLRFSANRLSQNSAFDFSMLN